MKRALAFLLALAISTTPCLPVLADGESRSEGPGSFVSEIMEANHIRDGNYAVAFMSTYDGETWFCNEEEYFQVASVYKLPLNMYYYELEAAGVLDGSSSVAGIPLSYFHYTSLEESNNPISQAMYEHLGGYAEFKRLILPYTGYSEDELDAAYYNENAFTARMVLNMLDYVWERREGFGELIDHLLAAQPGQYLESGETDCDIAQKYGYETYDGVLHVAVAGIVYADEPFLLAVLTRGSYAAVDALGQLCDAFVSWDARRIAEKEAQPPASSAPVENPEYEGPGAGEYGSLILQLVLAVCAASPLPAQLPWNEIFSAPG